MGLTSLQVCMDPSDWLQGTMSDDGVMDSSSPSSVDMLACSRPLMERRLRPQQDQALKCPRCESTHTKFCYYNNYSLSQPRYFCKTCRRYWTKGGTLRNIPVGGGCRKNKKSSSTSKKPSDHQTSSTTSVSPTQPFVGSASNPTDLQLSFPEVQLSHHYSSLIGAHGAGLGTSLLDNKYSNIDFLESKFDALVGHGVARGHDLLGSSSIGVDFGIVGGGGLGSDNQLGHVHHHHHNHGLATPSNFINPLSSSSAFGVSMEGNSSGVLDNTCQRLMLPYDYHNANSNEHEHQSGIIDVKPSTKLLSLEWQDNNGGINGLTSWGGAVFNGYTPSTTNPLI